MVVLGHVGEGAAAALVLAGPGLIALAAVRTQGRTARRMLVVSAACMLAVVAPPLAALAERGVTFHMLQHLLIVLGAAPALGTGLSLGRRRARSVSRRIHRGAVGAPSAPLVAGAVHLAVFSAWHVPALYDLALYQPGAHLIEHGTMLLSGAWWWWAAIHHSRRRRVGPAVMSAFGVATGGALVGVLLMFAEFPLYGHGDVVDQQIAGAVMTGLMGAVLTVLTGSAMVRVLGPSQVTRLSSPQRLGMAALVAPVMMAGGVVPAMPLVESTIGEELYRRDCLSCHGVEGEGTRRGTPLTGTGEAGMHYYLHTGRMPIASLDEPIRRGPSPYSPGEIESIIDHVRQFTNGPALPSETPVQEPGRGAQIYLGECAACHGASGNGGAMAGEGFAPAVHPASTDEVVAAMVSGPGDMPSFDAVLTPSEIHAVAAYVVTLADRPGVRAVLPTGRSGEGLVAGVLIVVLLTAARWIGKAS
jgi:ubiquinol-cytochrome c reductase cytochrome c subunit